MTIPTSQADALGVGRVKVNQLDIVREARDPTSTDGLNGVYPLHQRWVNTSANSVWELTNFTSSGGTRQATWVALGGGSNYPITPYVVGPTGQAGYQTIQSALDAANTAGGGVIFIQPGTYTENLTLYGNTEIVGTPGNSDSGTSGNTTVIIGLHIPPSTESFTFINVRLESATHIFSSLNAGSSSLILENCFIDITNGFLFNLPNWTGTFVTYNIGDGSTNNGMVNNIGGATCFFISATHGAGNGQTMLTSGPVIFQEIDLNCPWNAQTGTTIACDYVIFTQMITCSNNSTGSFNFCRFTTGVSSSLTMSSTAAVQITNSTITSSNNPAISGSGAGTLTLGDIVFTNSSSIAGTVTLAWAPTKTGELTVTGNINCTADLNLTSSATKITLNGGAATDFIGQATLVNGVSTILNTNIATTDRIYLTRSAKNASTAYGTPTATITAATNFVITSEKADTTTETNDQSTYDYFIVRQT